MSAPEYNQKQIEHWLGVAETEDANGRVEHAQAARQVAANLARNWAEHKLDEFTQQKDAPTDLQNVRGWLDTAERDKNNPEAYVFYHRVADQFALKAWEQQHKS